MRVLVVEDEIKTAEYLQQGLSESGYVVDIAHNGVDALHLFSHNTYSLVLLDVNLPGGLTIFNSKFIESCLNNPHSSILPNTFNHILQNQ